MKNNLKKILEKRGFRKVLLTEECLVRTGIKAVHRFNKIMENEVDLTEREIAGITDWLGVTGHEILQHNRKYKAGNEL